MCKLEDNSIATILMGIFIHKHLFYIFYILIHLALDSSGRFTEIYRSFGIHDFLWEMLYKSILKAAFIQRVDLSSVNFSNKK